jgi:quercetin dioxygenase-like cupin family protein
MPPPTLAPTQHVEVSCRAARRVIESPRTGERIEVVCTAEQTGGQLFAFELTLRPGGHVPSAHAHPEQVEHFTVLEGRVRFRLGLRSVVASPGDTLTIRPRTPHRLANAGSTPARLRVETRPALRMEEMLTVSADRFGGTQRRGWGTALDLGLFVREYDREVRAAVLPALVSAVTAPLRWLARALGRDLRSGR